MFRKHRKRAFFAVKFRKSVRFTHRTRSVFFRVFSTINFIAKKVCDLLTKIRFRQKTLKKAHFAGVNRTYSKKIDKNATKKCAIYSFRPSKKCHFYRLLGFASLVSKSHTFRKKNQLFHRFFRSKQHTFQSIFCQKRQKSSNFSLS
jgi:hypothetical protein